MRRLRNLRSWLVCIFLLALSTGSASAFFLWALAEVTKLRFENPWLLYLLPLAGVGMGFYYRHHRKELSSGNQVILRSVHKEEGKLPFALAPSILIATCVTHLFGGSAGREGTAVQMGAGLAALFRKLIPEQKASQNLLISCGIAGGFGGVFGTPFAAAMFALEFVRHRIISPKILACLATALGANAVSHLWGIEHALFPSVSLDVSFSLLLKLLVLGLCVAVASRLFLKSSHFAGKVFRARFPHEALRAAVGGICVIVLVFVVGTRDYLGLGVLAADEGSLTLLRCFSPEFHAPADAWLWKLVFTVVTLSAGFKGGEVTPLFFIGAALGNSLAWFLGAPVDLFAGIAMISLFASATKTPIASIVMGVELMGWQIAIPLAVITLFATRLSGSKSIFPKIEDL